MTKAGVATMNVTIGYFADDIPPLDFELNFMPNQAGINAIKLTMKLVDGMLSWGDKQYGVYVWTVTWPKYLAQAVWTPVEMIAYTNTWHTWTGTNEVAAMMVDGAHSVKQTGRGDRYIPRITGAKFTPVVYLKSTDAAYNTLVFVIDFYDGDDRAGVEMRVQLMHEDQSSMWFEWPGEKGSKLIGGNGVSSGKVEFRIDAKHEKALKYGKWFVNQFRIDDKRLVLSRGYLKLFIYFIIPKVYILLVLSLWLWHVMGVMGVMVVMGVICMMSARTHRHTDTPTHRHGHTPLSLECPHGHTPLSLECRHGHTPLSLECASGLASRVFIRLHT